MIHPRKIEGEAAAQTINPSGVAYLHYRVPKIYSLENSETLSRDSRATPIQRQDPERQAPYKN
jgi:hypothetical protein